MSSATTTTTATACPASSVINVTPPQSASSASSSLSSSSTMIQASVPLTSSSSLLQQQSGLPSFKATGTSTTTDPSQRPRKKRRMETALDVLHNALQHEPSNSGNDADNNNDSVGARSFLDQTCSIYVLDVATQPIQLYGGWNLLHQTLNEWERISRNDKNDTTAATTCMANVQSCSIQEEIQEGRNGTNGIGNGSTTSGRTCQPTATEAALCLLSDFAVQMARRSKSQDDQLVRTCIDNYCYFLATQQQSPLQESHHVHVSSNNHNHTDGTTSTNTTALSNCHQSSLQHLITDNNKLRDIVMGRIAALALDPPQQQSQPSHSDSTTTKWNTALQIFLHKAVAANAVANGPTSIRHLLLDWMIPTQPSPFSVACIVYHLAVEVDGYNHRYGKNPPHPRPLATNSTRSRRGTIIDTLQQLSLPVVTKLLGPILRTQTSQSTSQKSSSLWNCSTVMALQALQAWLKVTALSLAQAQHLCAKVQIDLVAILAHFLDYHHDNVSVMDALADLLEFVVENHPPWTTSTSPTKEEDDDDDDDVYYSTPASSPSSHVPLVSNARFQQTRYIMGVLDEESFRANVTHQQLHAIETKELSIVLQTLALSISRQHDTFVNLQQKESDNVDTQNTAICHGLARILVAICIGHSKVHNHNLHHHNCGEDGEENENEEADEDTNSSPFFQRTIPSAECWEFLSKCCSHPSVYIAAMSMTIITPVLRHPSTKGLATQWLPALQRRAILPYATTTMAMEENDNDIMGVMISMYDANQSNTSNNNHNSQVVDYQEFVHRFRDTVLKDALLACYHANPPYYLASCTAAIEEFCSLMVNDKNEEDKDNFAVTTTTVTTTNATGSQHQATASKVTTTTTKQLPEHVTALHLEAALFCMAAVAEYGITNRMETTSMTSISKTTILSSSNKNNISPSNNYILLDCLKRCIAALAVASRNSINRIVLSNSLTLKQMCHFINMYTRFFRSTNHELAGGVVVVLDMAINLCLEAFELCASETPHHDPLWMAIRRSCGGEELPFSEAASALESLLLAMNPHRFLSNKAAVAALGSAWEATFTACNRSASLLRNEDRMALGKGICCVLASLPKQQQATSLMALALPLLGCLETMIQLAEDNHSSHSSSTQDETMLAAILDRAASEMIVLTCICTSFSDAVAAAASNTSPHHQIEHQIGALRRRHATLVQPSVIIVRRAWSLISKVAERWSHHTSISDALRYMLVELVPSKCHTDASLGFLNQLFGLAQSILLHRQNAIQWKNEYIFRPVFDFLTQFVQVHGQAVQRGLETHSTHRLDTPTSKETNVAKTMIRLFAMLLQRLECCFESTWTSKMQQVDGQSDSDLETISVGAMGERDTRLVVGVTNDGMPPLFSLLSVCADHCPLSLLHLHSNTHAEGNSPNNEDEDEASLPDLLFLRRVLDSAVASLLEPHGDIGHGSVQFLLSIDKACGLFSNELSVDHNVEVDSNRYTRKQSFVEFFHNRIRPRVLCSLLVGCACGKVHQTALHSACHLLQRCLYWSNYSSVEIRRIVGQHDEWIEHFWLGDSARELLLVEMGRVADQRLLHHDNKQNKVFREISEFEEDVKLSTMLHDLWKVHHAGSGISNPETLAESGAGYDFLRKYSMDNGKSNDSQ